MVKGCREPPYPSVLTDATMEKLALTKFVSQESHCEVTSNVSMSSCDNIIIFQNNNKMWDMIAINTKVKSLCYVSYHIRKTIGHQDFVTIG